MLEKIDTKELDETLQALGFNGFDTASDFAPLSLASPDAYLNLELGSGTILLRGKLWRIMKETHDAGMTEILAIQTVNAKKEPKDWVLLQYSNPDQNTSIVDSFDRVPRKMVDPDALKHVYNLMIGLLGLMVAFLFYLLFKGYEFRPTWQTMISILSLGALGVFTVLYEEWKTEHDYVDTATLFLDAPSYPRNFVVRHPLTGDTATISGKVIPVGVKSTKIPISRIRGFSAEDIAEEIEFFTEMKDFEEEYYAMELEYRLSPKDEEAEQKYVGKKEELEEKRKKLLVRFKNLISSGEFDLRINEVKKKLEEDLRDKKVAEELLRRSLEKEEMLKRVTQLELALEDARKEIALWMNQANSEVVTKNAIVGARVAHALQRKAFIASYSPEELPGVNLKKARIPPWLFAGIGGAIVFVASLMLIYGVFSGIKTAFANMGPLGSFFFGLFAFLISLGLLIFTFVFIYNRMKLVATGTKKVVLQ